ncbi:hypothetical protein QJS10_CPA16g00262 [Acorus calamus]|uniref:Glycosyltransferase family 92 protein n=1 Tax=Acorus calamus TaxID=4465 RepID=A0AAV9D354_ACOCL|nr:hypothetical protein QJS10_CPA16g00262 [Acorus calamus]
MKDHHRRKRSGGGDLYGWWRRWGRFFLFSLSIFLFSSFAFSPSLRIFRESFRPVLLSTWRNPPPLSASSTTTTTISDDHPTIDRRLLSPHPSLEIRDAVNFPDQTLLFLKHPPNPLEFTKHAIHCAYYPPSSTSSSLHLPPISIDAQILRCPTPPRGFLVSVSFDRSDGRHPPPSRPHQWHSLAYEAVIDSKDSTTVVFVKGLNLRPERLADASRFACVYGWDFSRPRYLLTSDALSVAQEIVRCRTPLSVLNPKPNSTSSVIKASVIFKRFRAPPLVVPSVARPAPVPPARRRRAHALCACTMVRNQARFLREWVTYHARVGVERWFVYDNNSDDDIKATVDSMAFNVTRHPWPWIKTQEAGFAHCALRARAACEWVAFIDVDEFLHLPNRTAVASMREVLAEQPDDVGEVRASCHSFGPSGRKRAPARGVTAGYTCRMASPERHKSIVRPEALDDSLMNVVHHFHLREGFGYVNLERSAVVINHYKYQVWEVFKEKFYRRVATYVADWHDKENEGSKDRAPGLGTEAVEPPDWAGRFCEVHDTGLRDWVIREFTEPGTGRLAWEVGGGRRRD